MVVDLSNYKVLCGGCKRFFHVGLCRFNGVGASGYFCRDRKSCNARALRSAKIVNGRLRK